MKNSFFYIIIGLIISQFFIYKLEYLIIIAILLLIFNKSKIKIRYMIYPLCISCFVALNSYFIYGNLGILDFLISFFKMFNAVILSLKIKENYNNTQVIYLILKAIRQDSNKNFIILKFVSNKINILAMNLKETFKYVDKKNYMSIILPFVFTSLSKNYLDTLDLYNYQIDLNKKMKKVKIEKKNNYYFVIIIILIEVLCLKNMYF